MSPLTAWLGAGAALVVVLFVANARYVRRARGSTAAAAPDVRQRLRQRVTLGVGLSAGVGVAMLLAGLSARYVAPDGLFAAWLEEPLAWLVYAAWTWIVATLAAVLPPIVAVLRRR